MMKTWSCALIVLMLVFMTACTKQTARESSASPPVSSEPESSAPTSNAPPVSSTQPVRASPFQLGEERFLSKGIGGDENYSWERLEYEVGFGTYPHIDGSTVCEGMAKAFIQEHLRGTRHADMEAHFSKTHEAYVNLITRRKLEKGNRWMRQEPITDPSRKEETGYRDYFFKDDPVNLILVTAPSEDEKKLAKKHDVELYMKPLCLDSFIFITYKGNPVDSLTVEQIQKIYTGKITNWKEVGGEDRPIRAYQRNKNSGSQTAMEEMVMKGKKMMKAKTELIDSMEGLVRVIESYDNEAGSLGYTYQYYLDSYAFKIDDDPGFRSGEVKTLAVEGATPDPAHMRDGSYPFTVSYYGVIREEDRDKTPGKFLDWILSPEGQACVDKAGYCTVKG